MTSGSDPDPHPSNDPGGPDEGPGSTGEPGAVGPRAPGDHPERDAPAPGGSSAPGGALAQVGRHGGHAPTPPSPPRRTGIFVDAEELRSHVGGLLRVILGGYEVDTFGNFTFTHENARVFVTIGATPIGPQVGVFSVTNLEVALTPELSAFLLTRNHTMAFGAFSYDPGNQAIWLRHTLLGATLDLPELQAAVAAIATTAASVDDGIRERFGGRTFQEAPSEVQRRMEPPEPDQETETPGVTGYL
jgi:hypothetical protein